jgi:hypothetical protein
MDKQIFFGAYTQSDINEMGLTDAHEHNGTFYEFRLDVYLEDGFCRLTDSIGRMVPFDMTHYQEFAEALHLVNSLQNLQDMKQTMDMVLENGKRAVGLRFDRELGEITTE